MLIIGLTGSVASGKNFVASRFQKLNIPVFDADFEVHKLLALNKEIFLQVKKSFPKAISNDKIDRKLLGEEVFGNHEKLQNLEQIIYPLLRKGEDEFIKKHRRNREKFVVLNIPLLFEKGGYKRCDKIIVVLASKKIRLHRFKQRYKKSNGNIDNQKIEGKFYNINHQQMSDVHKKNRADFLIHNGLSKSFCNAQIKTIVKNICNIQNAAL